MDLYGHNITLLGAFLRAKVELKKALELVEEYGAKLCITDAIRCYVVGEDVVKYGRGYSHFTDGCGMTLPFGEALKGFSNIHETQFVTGEGYKNKCADEPTDFALFIRMNPAMFAKENEDWGIAALSHLHQDVDSDLVWQQEICTCDAKNDIVVYNHTGKQVTGKKFREDMALANIYIHRMFVEYIENVFEQTITEEEFMARVFASIDKHFNAPMAANTKTYLELDRRIYGATEEEKDALVKDIVATGMFVSRKHLEWTAVKLFQDAMTSLNPLINHVVRM